MNFNFEVVVIPVSDVDQAKKFYESTQSFRAMA
jgi:predicted enzyme related to lactoylglutathione lyase